MTDRQLTSADLVELLGVLLDAARTIQERMEDVEATAPGTRSGTHEVEHGEEE